MNDVGVAAALLGFVTGWRFTPQPRQVSSVPRPLATKKVRAKRRVERQNRKKGRNPHGH